MSTRILTIGHSNHSIEHFVEVLRSHGISAVGDVRSAPFSRYAPQFNKVPLKVSLQQAGIGYAFLGKELGARSTDRSCYVDGRVQYARLAETKLFRSGIQRLLRGTEERLVAIMCTEKDPLDCHRTLLVARALLDCDARVEHVLANGAIESHDDTMQRLLEKQGFGQPSLLESIDEQLEKALQLQEREIAFVDPEFASATTSEPST